MNETERDKLRTMLNYWIEHNQEHGQEFREWADKAKAFDEGEAGEEISAAAQEMDRVNELLSRALNRLQKKER